MQSNLSGVEPKAKPRDDKWPDTKILEERAMTKPDKYMQAGGDTGNEDGSGSAISSGGTTRCPAATSDDGEDASGNASGSVGAAERLQDTWSPDDNGSSFADDRTEDNANLPSLCKDGASANAGSVGHPNDCKPCAFYCFSLRGCRNGVGCSYCHLFHESKLRQRREEWKRQQRAKRGKQRRRPVQEQEEAQEDGRRQETTLQESLVQTTATMPKSEALSGPQPMAEAPQLEAEAPQAEDLPIAKVAYTRSEGEGADVNGGSTAAVHVKAPMHVQPKLTPWQPQQQLLMQQQEKLAQLNLWSDSASADFFSYTPDNLVTPVGQMVEMWPPTELISAGMIFAVSPDLPPGLALAERVGLIHGRPEQGTSGPTTHFVTACRPGDHSFSVLMAMVTVQVTGPHGNGSSFDQQGPANAAAALGLASRSTHFGSAPTSTAAQQHIQQQQLKQQQQQQPLLTAAMLPAALAAAGSAAAAQRSADGEMLIGGVPTVPAPPLDVLGALLARVATSPAAEYTPARPNFGS